MKNSLLWSIMTMIKPSDSSVDPEEEERQFYQAFGVFERKLGRGLFFSLATLGGIFFASAFIEFRGTLDFVFRTTIGILLVLFATWGIRHIRR